MTDAADGIFLIPEENFKKFEAAIEKLSRKALKLVGEAITPVVFGYQMVEVRPNQFIKHFEVLLGGPEVKLNDWEFLATIDHSLEGGNILRTVPGKTIPDTFRNAVSECQHCAVKRFRRDTYVLRNTVTDEVKQVGRTCLKDFLGHKSPEAMAKLAEVMGYADEVRKSSLQTVQGFNTCVIDLQQYLVLVAAAARINGWVPRSKANEHLESTAFLAEQALINMTPAYFIDPLDEDRELAQNAIKWAQGLDQTTQHNQFLYTINVIAKSQYIERRSMGYAAAIVSSYAKAHGLTFDKNSVQGPRYISKHVGEEGTRIEFQGVIKAQSEFESQFGVGVRISILNQQGDEFVWFTGRGYDLADGAAITVKGTVKAHTEFKNTKQTQLTRCRIDSIA